MAQSRALIDSQARAGVPMDMSIAGGMLQSERTSDLADLYSIWTAAHNPASLIVAIASARVASSWVRIDDFGKSVDAGRPWLRVKSYSGTTAT